jgi:hypothetical protein
VQRSPAREAAAAPDHDRRLGAGVPQKFHRPLLAFLPFLELGRATGTEGRSVPLHEPPELAALHGTTVPF